MATNEEEKNALSPRQCTVSQVDCNDGKTTWISHWIASYSPDLAPSDYWLFSDLKRMLKGKIFGSNEEVISENQAYFKAKDKSFYKKDIELLEKRWNQHITLEGKYVDE